MSRDIKTPAEIQAMRDGGKILAEILAELREYVEAGMNCLEIDKWVEAKILANGAAPSYYEDSTRFPGAICISVNEEFVHTPPKDRILDEGDKVAFDLTITYKGMHTDSAFTMIVGGEGTASEKHLLRMTERSLYAGIEKVRAGARVGDISAAVEKVLKKGKLNIIKEYIGHGIGREMHEAPDVPNFGVAGTGPILRAGDTICIEPMATLGKPVTRVDEDGWTVEMKDGSLSAHFEHTVLVVEDGFEILTQ